MNTFANRLKLALEKRAISQAKAAKLAGISQQSINYIINSNLSTSKLGPRIAEALQINPDWLIYGKGKFEDTKIYDLPILHSQYMLKKFIAETLDHDKIDFTIIDEYLGEKAFAYLLRSNELLICCDSNYEYSSAKYLTMRNNELRITKAKKEISFPIFEWRTRSVDF